MNILYIGDIMAEPGILAVEKLLPGLKESLKIDLVIAQAENLSEGKGIAVKDFERIQKAGIDFCTGGNWSLNNPEIFNYLEDINQPIIRPANYPSGTPGHGYKYIKTNYGNVLVISILGQIVGKDASKPVDNPLKIIDQILEEESGFSKVATVVNFHGDYSSEKLVFGYYLDGRVTAVIGDHWHIPTADSMVLPGGTAHITDVGMCGTTYSSLGVKTDTIIQRWRDNKVLKNEIELEGQLQFNALFIEVNTKTGLAVSTELIQKTIEQN
jgi:metallophosphoesterase (TIGR00282 family)